MVPAVSLITQSFCLSAPAADRPFKREASSGRVSDAQLQSAKIKPDLDKANPAFSFDGAKEVDGLFLKQEYRFIGKSTTYFSPLGISLASSTLSVLFNSKNQVICLYSNDTKKFYACDPVTWKKKSKIMFRSPNIHARMSPWKLLRQEKVAGLNTKVYSRFSYLSGQTNEDTIWVTSDIKMTPASRGLLYSLLKVADNVPDGVPLRHALAVKHNKVVDSKADFLGRRRVRQAADSDHVDYETFSIKKVKIPVEKYIMPKGYKRADSEMEIFFNTEEAMGGLDMPDLGLDAGAKNSQIKK